MKRLLGLFLILSFLALLHTETAEAGSVNINLNVAVCNMNSICEDVIGETTASCPADCPAPTSTPPVSGGTPGLPATSSLPVNSLVGPIVIAPFEDHAIFHFSTKLASLMTFTWGKTPEYEIGSLADSWYHTKFDLTIENLIPSTRYYYSISLKDTLGRTLNFDGDFRTLSVPDRTPPPPVQDFSYAIAGKNSLILKWKNPDVPDFASVRLVRSDISYPRDPLSGKVVYEGGGEYVTDSDVESGKTYFYSIFAKDLSENISSPAILRVPFDTSKIDTNDLPKKDYLLDDNVAYDFTSNRVPFDIGSLSANEGAFCITPNQLLNINSADGQKAVSEEESLTALSGLRFSQQNNPLSYTENNVTVGPGIPVEIEIPRDKSIFSNNSSLALCLKGASVNERFGFLFDVDQQKNVFKITIPPFSLSGDYQFYVGMLKLDGRETALVSGVFSVQSDTTGQYERLRKNIAEAVTNAEKALAENYLEILIVLISLGIAALLAFLFKKIF